MAQDVGEDKQAGMGGVPGAEGGSSGMESWYFDNETGTWEPRPSPGGGGVPLIGRATVPTAGILPAGVVASIPPSVFAALAAGGVSPAVIAALKKLASAGGLGGAMLAGNRMGNVPTTGVPPELSQLLALSMQRMQAQGPLSEAINRQALGGLPTYAKSGGGGTGSGQTGTKPMPDLSDVKTSADGQTGTRSSSWLADLLKAR